MIPMTTLPSPFTSGCCPLVAAGAPLCAVVPPDFFAHPVTSRAGTSRAARAARVWDFSAAASGEWGYAPCGPYCICAALPRSRRSTGAVVLPRRGEDVENPRLRVFLIPDEPAGPVQESLRRPVGVAGAEQPSFVGADPEVQLPLEDHAELLVVGVAVVRCGPGAAGDPPQAEHET